MKYKLSHIEKNILLGIGGIYLAAFLCLTFFGSFWIKFIPSCYMTDALIVYVECGRDFFGKSLGIIFMYFTPLFLQIVVLAFYGLGVSLTHFDLTRVLWTVLTLGFAALVWGSAIRLVARLIYGFRRTESRKRAGMILAIILLPSLLSLIVKTYETPPMWLNRSITIGMWHDNFVVPRKYMAAWSLVEPEPPQKQVFNQYAPYHRQTKAAPFILFDIPRNLLDPAYPSSRNWQITVSPHSLVTEQDLFTQREKYLKKKIDDIYYRDKLPKYSSPVQEDTWQVYKRREDMGDHGQEPDYYVRRDKENRITHLLECTANNECAGSYDDFSGQFKSQRGTNRCFKPGKCSCIKICTDKSLGNPQYSVTYTFGKSSLPGYLEAREKIDAFVESFKQQ